MNKKVLLSGDSNLQLRFLCPQDVEEVKKLCAEWFPITYPNTWFHDITSNEKFYSLAAIYNLQIVGLLVSELKPLNKCSVEDRDILCSKFLNTACVAYILTIGVAKEYRRNGIASLLLDNLITYIASSPDTVDCKALYLHTLTSNISAISFYERRKFKPHSYLPKYYFINGEALDGFSYVLYINDGYPPWNILDYMRSCCKAVAFFHPYNFMKIIGHFVLVIYKNTIVSISKLL